MGLEPENLRLLSFFVVIPMSLITWRKTRKDIDFGKSNMLQTKKHGKAGKKPGVKGAKKAAAGGSKGKGKKNPKKKPNKKGAKKNSDDSKDKEDSKEKDKSPMIHVS